jgi:hypothetical protein
MLVAGMGPAERDELVQELAEATEEQRRVVLDAREHSPALDADGDLTPHRAREGKSGSVR